MRTGQGFVWKKNKQKLTDKEDTPTSWFKVESYSFKAHCLEVIVAAEPQKKLSMPVEAEYSFLGRSEGCGAGRQVKEPDKPFNYFSELENIDSQLCFFRKKFIKHLLYLIFNIYFRLASNMKIL